MEAYTSTFYTCTECGRCSDNCPANAIGETPFHLKLFTIKLRDHCFDKAPLFARRKGCYQKRMPTHGRRGL